MENGCAPSFSLQIKTPRDISMTYEETEGVTDRLEKGLSRRVSQCYDWRAQFSNSPHPDLSDVTTETLTNPPQPHSAIDQAS